MCPRLEVASPPPSMPGGFTLTWHRETPGMVEWLLITLSLNTASCWRPSCPSHPGACILGCICCFSSVLQCCGLPLQRSLSCIVVSVHFGTLKRWLLKLRAPQDLEERKAVLDSQVPFTGIPTRGLAHTLQGTGMSSLLTVLKGRNASVVLQLGWDRSWNFGGIKPWFLLPTALLKSGKTGLVLLT